MGADGYGRPETETETFESSLMSRHGFGEHEDSVEPEPRPSSNNSGQLYTDFTEDNLTRDNTRDNSEDVSLSSDDEDRILDGEGMTKEELLRARIAKRRMAKKTTPNVPAERIKKVRKVREEKAITLEGLGGPPSHSHPHRLPPHMMGRFPPHPPSRLAAGPTAAQKKKKAEEDLEEGELSDDEEGCLLPHMRKRESQVRRICIITMNDANGSGKLLRCADLLGNARPSQLLHRE